MRFMLIVKASDDSEAGVMPREELLRKMIKYEEALVEAGVLLTGEGLQPSSKGVRVRFAGNDWSVTDGPFLETKELIAGYWLWQCDSMETAIEWLKRAPFERGAEVELRPVLETDDFGDELTPALREKEVKLRERIAVTNHDGKKTEEP